MRAGGEVGFTPAEHLGRLVAGRAQGRGGLGIERDVEMDAHFLERRRVDFVISRGAEKRGQVDEARDPAVRPPQQDLMEIDRLVERADRRERRRVARIECQRAGEVDLGNPDAGGGQRVERFAGGVVFQREVAGVVVHADPAADGFNVRCRRVQALEKRERFLRIFEMPERLRFQAEVEIVIRFRCQRFQPARQFD